MKTITCFSAKEWRAWLRKNHRREDRVMLIRFKRHTGKPSFNQRGAMDEAICFGWIDTTLKRLDDERYGVTFVKRKKSSKWSENTFARAREMIRLGKMSKFGLEMYKKGKLMPPHDDGIPKNPSLSDVPELKRALVESGLLKKFEKIAPSYRRTYYRWILSGKREETRAKRIKQTLAAAKKGRLKEELLGTGKKDV